MANCLQASLHCEQYYGWCFLHFPLVFRVRRIRTFTAAGEAMRVVARQEKRDITALSPRSPQTGKCKRVPNYVVHTKQQLGHTTRIGSTLTKNSVKHLFSFTWSSILFKKRTDVRPSYFYDLNVIARALTWII